MGSHALGATSGRHPFRLAASLLIAAACTAWAAPVQASPWTFTQSMAYDRAEHVTMTVLNDGRVLAAGGDTYVVSGGNTSAAEIYDPTAGTWSITGAMTTVRSQHTATLLADGRVLVTGGRICCPNVYLASAEIYDPASSTWTATGSMASSRVYHVATALADGRVLVTGGWTGSAFLASAEIYDPAAGTWSTTSPMAGSRISHTGTLMADERVLVVAGRSDFSNQTLTAELFDPSSGTWTNAAAPSIARSTHTATMLLDGRLLIAGGKNGMANTAAVAELYDQASGTWANTGALATRRYHHSATLLPDGRVLAAGGYGPSDALRSSELYNPSTGSWVFAGNMEAADGRAHHGAALLADGRVLAAGGWYGNPLKSAEIFDATPVFAVTDKNVTETDSGITNATFTVTRLPAATATATVTWATAAGGGATSGSDFVAASGTLTFAPGQSGKTVSVGVVGDVIYESTENFHVNLTNPAGATIFDGQGLGRILDNDVAPVLAFGPEPTNTEADTGMTSASFTVTLTGASQRTVDVAFATSAGTAASDVDFVAKSGVLRFTAGQTTKTVKVQIIGDLQDEPTETYFLNLSAPVNATMADSIARGMIQDDEPTAPGSPDLSISDATVTETDGGTVLAIFTVTLSAPAPPGVTFSYATGAAGTATAGVDYVDFRYRSAPITEGTTSRTVTVAVYGETLDEANETFYVNVTGASNANIVDSQGKATIIDDDSPLEPDGFPEGTDITTAYPGVTLSVVGFPERQVHAVSGYSAFNGRNLATTGRLVFGPHPFTGEIPQGWSQGGDYGLLRADFATPRQVVGIDLLYDDNDDGMLQAFGSSGNLLATATGAGDGRGSDPNDRLTITRPTADIAYVIMGGANGETLLLDRMVLGPHP